MLFIFVCLVAHLSVGLTKPLFDMPYLYTYPAYYNGYQPVYQQPLVDSFRMYHGQPVISDPVLSYQAQQPIQAVPYPLISAYAGYQGGQAYPYGSGLVLAYDPSQAPETVAGEPEHKIQPKNEAPVGEKMADGVIMSRTGPTSIEASDMASQKEEMIMTDTMGSKAEPGMEKQARIFYNSGYPFGTSQTYKQPVLVNGNQGQKVGVLRNQYLLKLASTTRNPDGSLASKIYPEFGGGTLFDTPAGNYNGR